MALRTVNAGDLITHQDWNDLVGTVTALLARVDELSTGGGRQPPRITLVLPSDTVTAGDTIRIFGSNFDVSRGGQSVFFGSSQAVNFRDGTSDTLLIVDVPDPVPGATPVGAAITMTVANLTSTATWALTIKSKPVVVTGGLEFAFVNSEPVTPTPGQGIRYNFRLTSLANADLMVTLAPMIQVIGAAGLDLLPGNAVTVHDDDGALRADRRIALTQGQTKTVSIRLAEIPAITPNGTRYTVSVSASAPGVQTITENLPEQVVGQASEQPDPTITNLEFSSVQAGTATFTPGGAGGVDGTLVIPGGSTAVIALDATFANIAVGTQNRYNLSAEVVPATAGWTARVNTVSTPAFYDIPGPGAQRFPNFDIIVPTTGGPVSMRLTITRSGAAADNKRSVTYRVQRS